MRAQARRRWWRQVAIALALALAAPPLASPAAPEVQGRGGGGPAVVINEVLPAPRTLFGSEWVELHNPGGAAADIGGWTLDDVPDAGSRPFTLPAGTQVAAGGFLVLYNSTTGVALNNDGDAVRLLDPSGAEADRFQYASSDHDASWGRSPDGGPDWVRAFEPTPGAPNAVPPPVTPAGRALLLTRVLYRAYSGKADEFAAVTNPSPSETVDVGAWRLSDGDSSAVLPRGTRLGPLSTLTVTGSASDFLSDMGFLPDLETLATRPDVPDAPFSGSWPSLANDGGCLALEDPAGNAVDVFAWGKESSGAGWTGPPAPLLSAGEVARRAVGATGEWLDTNSSPDWPPGRALTAGRTEFAPASFDAGQVLAFVSPDSAFEAASGVLDGARRSIFLAAYQLESYHLAERLVRAAGRGVEVRVLLEGRPVGGLADQERALASRLASSGASVGFLAPPPSGGGDRYTFLHAKYCVVDGLTCLVGSENWKDSGYPLNPSTGNRGWGAVVKSAGLASYLLEVFDRDFDPVMNDVVLFNGTGEFAPPPGFAPNTSVPSGPYSPRFASASFGGPVRVSPVLSPDTSLLANASVLGLLGSASRTLHLELPSCALSWYIGGREGPNQYLEAVLSAARRGVEVRVLLDGAYLEDDEAGADNGDILNHLKYTAAREGLDLEARLFRVKGVLKLHNKGVIADGERVLVSSINWGTTSVSENREVGLVIESAGVAGYFERTFSADWNASSENGSGGGSGRPGGGRDRTCTVAALAPVALAAAVIAAGFKLSARDRTGPSLLRIRPRRR